MSINEKELKIKILECLIPIVHQDSHRNNKYVAQVLQPILMNTNLINNDVKDFIFMFLCGVKNIYNAVNLPQFNSKAELYETILKAIESNPKMKLNFEIAIKKINIIYEKFKINNQLSLNITPEEQLKNNLEQVGLTNMQNFLIETYNNETQSFNPNDSNTLNSKNPSTRLTNTESFNIDDINPIGSKKHIMKI